MSRGSRWTLPQMSPLPSPGVPEGTLHDPDTTYPRRGREGPRTHVPIPSPHPPIPRPSRPPITIDIDSLFSYRDSHDSLPVSRRSSITGRQPPLWTITTGLVQSPTSRSGPGRRSTSERETRHPWSYTRGPGTYGPGTCGLGTYGPNTCRLGIYGPDTRGPRTYGPDTCEPDTRGLGTCGLETRGLRTLRTHAQT